LDANDGWSLQNFLGTNFLKGMSGIET
jgi:hypothetical protein